MAGRAAVGIRATAADREADAGTTGARTMDDGTPAAEAAGMVDHDISDALY
jgi:hypothetical protein